MGSRDQNKPVGAIAQEIISADVRKQDQDARDGKAAVIGGHRISTLLIIGTLIAIGAIGFGIYFFGGNFTTGATNPPEVPVAPPVIITNTSTATSTDTSTPTYTATSTSTGTPTNTPTATVRSTDTFTPTPAKLIGTINQKTNGHFAPAEPFMGPYGLPKGARVQAIGRTDDGKWILIQAIGGHKPAWISALSIDLNSDPMTLPVVGPYQILPISNFYGPPDVTSATSNGTSATLEWLPVKVRIDLVAGYPLNTYIIAVSTCNQGKKVFLAFGTNDTTITVPIDNGCGQSTAQVILQFKEGFVTGALVPLK
jgi:hypothetical protein